jgi:glycolate oxidase
MNKNELIKQLLKILPADAVLYENEDLKPFECDGLSAYRELPLAVALPETEEQVRDILLLCRRENVPVVARVRACQAGRCRLPAACC